MAEGRARENWTHTSHLLALVANVNRDPKKSRAFQPADFNPYARRDREVSPIQDMAALRQAFGARSAK